MAVYATSLRKKLGVKENDVVAALLPNSPEFPVVALGTIQAGCIFSPINPIYKESKNYASRIIFSEKNIPWKLFYNT